jgi:hypothetical protein
MNFIRLISILILLSLSPVKGFTQSCPIHLVTHYPNGAKGCLTDLPLSKIVDGKWGRQISEIANTAGSYAIAGSSICKFVAIGTAGRPMGTFVEGFKEQRIRTALSNCPSNCECAIVVDDGKVLLPQNLASLIGVNSETVASNSNSSSNSQGQANAPVNSNSDTARSLALTIIDGNGQNIGRANAYQYLNYTTASSVYTLVFANPLARMADVTGVNFESSLAG